MRFSLLAVRFAVKMAYVALMSNGEPGLIVVYASESDWVSAKGPFPLSLKPSVARGHLRRELREQATAANSGVWLNVEKSGILRKSNARLDKRARICKRQSGSTNEARGLVHGCTSRRQDHKTLF